MCVCVVLRVYFAYWLFLFSVAYRHIHSWKNYKNRIATYFVFSSEKEDEREGEKIK